MILLGLALTACGVSFSETFDGTELFKSLSLTGDRTAGSELTVTVMVTQTYRVPVEVACFYEDPNNLSDDDYHVAFQERAQRVGETVLPPATTTDRKSIERQPVSFTFSVRKPGDYFLACLTPAAPDNGLGVNFTIEKTGSSKASAN